MNTGEIDLTASTVGGPYTITYTTPGPDCANSSTFDITINAEDDPSFSYPQASYCQGDADPVATITGTGGGTFSGPPEIIFLDVNTGEIDLTASTVGGPYTITYTTAGVCASTDVFDVSIIQNGNVSLFLPDISGNTGDQIDIPVTLQGFIDIVSITFSIQWNNTVIDLVNPVNLATLDDLDASDFNQPDGQTLTLNWSTAAGQTLADGSTLFDLRFDLIGPECSSSAVTFENNPVSILFSDINGCAADYVVVNGSLSIDGTGSSDPPAVAFKDSTNCTNDPVPELDASGVGLQWYDDKALTSKVHDGHNFIPGIDNTIAGNYAFYVTQTIGSCGESLPDSVKIEYIAPPLAPSASNTTYTLCQGDAAPVLSATGTGLQWYTDAALTNLVATTPNYTPDAADLDTDALGTTLFYVTQSNSCGESSALEIVVEVIDCTPDCDQFALTVLGVNTSCADTDDGSVYIFVDNPITGNFQYSLDSGTTYYDFDNTLSTQTEDTLSIGTHAVLVRAEGSGCDADTFNIIVGAEVTLLASSLTERPVCQAANGSINIEIEGGDAPFIVDLRNNAGDTLAADSLGVFSGLAAGKYTYTVTEASGCTFSPQDSVELVPSVGELITSATKTDPSCNSDDGELIMNAEGGSGLYTYQLYLPDSTLLTNQSGEFLNLEPGDYRFSSVDDSTGCQSPVKSISLIITPNFVATVDTTSFENVACHDEPTGRAIINVTGGSGTYEYSVNGNTWNTFISGTYIEDLPPWGTYTILIRESSDDLCYEQVQVTIENENPPLAFTYSSTEASCNNNDGILTIGSISGGVPPYEISMDSGAFSSVELTNLPVFSNLSGGLRNIRIRDVNGCMITDDAVRVDFPGYILADIQQNAPTCEGNGKDGAIVVFIGSAENEVPPPYEFGLGVTGMAEEQVVMRPIQPDNPVSIDTLTNGSYYILLSAENGCDSRLDVDITGGPVLLDFDSVEITDVICKGGSGAIFVENITGDRGLNYIVEIVTIPDVTITYSNIFNYEDLTNGLILDERNTNGIPAGEYQLRIRQNQDGCNLVSVSENFELTEPDGLLDFEVTKINNSFPDYPSGSIEILISQSGGEPYETSVDMNRPEFPGQDIFRDWTLVTADPNNRTLFEFTHENVYSGFYDVYVRDAYGCVIMKQVTVDYDTAIFIPNIFTPNFDNHNDVFYIRNLPDAGSGTSLIITNRWGNIIYQSDDYHYDDLWDGGDNPDGTYFYKLNIPGKGSHTGWVEIWRGASR